MLSAVVAAVPPPFTEHVTAWALARRDMPAVAASQVQRNALVDLGITAIGAEHLSAERTGAAQDAVFEHDSLRCADQGDPPVEAAADLPAADVAVPLQPDLQAFP